MGKKTIRTGIIGAGFSATFHFEAVNKLYATDAQGVGVYCRTKQTREAFAKKRGIQAFDTLEALLDKVDVVHVCTAAVSHEPVAITALERDKFAIVEKPLTGFFGDGSEDFNGETFPKQQVLDHALASIERMLDTEKKSKGKIQEA